MKAPMSPLSPRGFHSLLLVPALIPFLMFFGPGSSINQPPIAVDDSFVVHGFKPLNASTDLLGNDSDPDGDAIDFDRVVSGPFHGALSIPFGQAPQRYTPNLGYTGPDSFTYRICDNLGLCADATVSLDVRNAPPTPGNDSIVVHGFKPINTPTDLLGNDNDPDGDAIDFDRVVTGPFHGALSIPFGHAPQGYTPNLGYTGPDSFTYRICDNLGLCADATVSLDVRNNAP